MFNHTVISKQVTINAPRELVWDILVDLKSYGEWNPFTHRVDSTLKVGDPIDLYVRMPKRGDRMQRERVKAVVAPMKLAWGMSMGAELVLKALREQILVAVSDEVCTYQTTDKISGLLTPVVIKFFGEEMENGFNNMADALKVHAENAYQSTKRKVGAVRRFGERQRTPTLP